jgi:glycerophosphoryl diester phosphodiesterase
MSKAFWDEPPIAIAHRGGDAAGSDKENTLDAFAAASKMGYKHAETDVVLAASGEVVVIHGARNWLQAGVSRGLSRRTLQLMTLDQMRQFVRPGGNQVPTLEELLTAFPKMKFIIDLKNDEAAVPLAKLLTKLNVLDRVCVTSFGYNRILKFLGGCGNNKVSTGLTVGRGLRFRNINMFMLKSGHLKNVEAIFMHHSLVSRPMISLVHRRGFKAIVWTANSSIGIKHAIGCGADGIISDNVKLLKEILAESKT